MHVKLIDEIDLPPEQRFVAAILARALKDASSCDPDHKAAARAFWSNHRDSLRWWANAIGVEVKTLKRLAAVHGGS